MVRGGRENKCHHESLGYWETRTGARGIWRKIITSFFFHKRACGENGSENVQKMEQETGRASFVGHGCSVVRFWVMGEAEGSHGSITRPGSLSPAPTSISHDPEMPTDLPYAADAEDSLSYDELQVRPHLLNEFVGSSDFQSPRCSVSSIRGRYPSHT